MISTMPRIQSKLVTVLFLLGQRCSLTTARSISDSCCFIPCAAPRFDVFSDSLVSTSWTCSEQKVPVEEVMRSCGGAVQGIRERALVGHQRDDNGLYLNRANDGFIFFDSGAYSFGPISIPNSNDDLHVTNLMFGKNSRLLLTNLPLQDTTSADTISSASSSSSSCTDSMKSGRLFLRKSYGGTDIPLPVPTLDWISNPYESLSVDFGSAIQCSMSNGMSNGQSWNLQRAKWTKRSVDVVENQDIQPPSDLSCWVISHQSLTQFLTWARLPDSRLDGMNEKWTVDHMGALCHSTGLVQSMVRLYDSHGTISTVMHLQGRLDNQFLE